MKYILAILLLASTAQADYLPAGCYVADSYRTDKCWEEVDGVSSFNWHNFDFSNPDDEQYYYGSAVAALVQDETYWRWQAEAVEAELVQQKSITSELTAANSKVTANLNRQLQLVKKLKRACGSKCKGVR